MKQARKHLEGSGFACAVGPEKSHKFPMADFEVHPVHGNGLIIAPMKKATNGSSQARFFPKDSVHLAQATSDDSGFHD
jgi:hypothetical protein